MNQEQQRASAEPFPRGDGYLHLLSYVTSNARMGEIMAVNNYSQLVGILEDTEEKIQTVQQAKEECRHIVLLEKLAASG